MVVGPVAGSGASSSPMENTRPSFFSTGSQPMSPPVAVVKSVTA